MTDERDDEKTRKDLTFIGDLPEFEHEEDADVDRLLDPDDLEDDDSPPPPLPNQESEENPFLSPAESSEEQDVVEIEETEEVGESFGEENSFESESEEDSFAPTETTFEENETTSDWSEEDSSFADDDQSFEETTPIEEEPLFEEEEEEEIKPAPAIVEQGPPPKQRETFEDLRQFGGAISYGVMAQGGHPPFSIVVKNITYKEDAEDILAILSEHGLVTDENEPNFRHMLESGTLLVSQVGEYSAIYLCHRLRRFGADIQMGLSDELHPSKSYEREGRGLVSRYGLKQNIREELNLERRPIRIEAVMSTTADGFEGYRIVRYIDIITSHTIVHEDELRLLHESKEASDQDDLDEEFELASEEHEITAYHLGLGELYRDLATDLKNQAYKIDANAVLGINYQITPLIGPGPDGARAEYKITCSGNAVWIEGLK
jgi:uncharacterized protein YbjQ (UPF0145 family)